MGFMEKHSVKKLYSAKNMNRNLSKYTISLSIYRYNGVSNHTLFEKSVQEVKDEVKAKLNQHKEAVLQKIK